MLEDLSAEFQGHGYNVLEIIPDGKIHRFPLSGETKKESGWYVIFRGETKNGGLFFAGSFGDWKSGQKVTCCTLKSKSKEDKKFIEVQFKKAEKAFDLAEKEKWEETKKTCTSFWDTLPPIKNIYNFPYLVKKGLSNGFGARFSADSIYLSVSDIDGNIWGIQKILPDGSKFFQPGTKKKGNFFQIGEDVSRETFYICEGFATGASIHEATKCPVFCAFDSGNLKSVSEALRKHYPEKAFAICADNDLWATKPGGTAFNPGRESAEKCGLPIILPTFSDLDSKPTDFNDLHVLEGIEAVQSQILQVKAEKQYVKCLGFRGDSYFYTSSDNLQITEISAHSPMALLKLMPLSYWSANFYNEKTKQIHWTEAISELKENCRARGIFTKKDVRGHGVWIDNGKVVIHLGDRLFYDGADHHVHSLMNKYVYEFEESLPSIHPSPLTDDELKPFLELIKMLSYTHKQQGLFLGGWIALSGICGALKWRPHLWLTGESGSGKSTVKELVDSYLDNAFKRLSVSGATTEAGIRQAIKAAAIPVVFDEFEPEDRRSSDRVQACLELIRQASTENASAILKGSSDGESVSYYARFSALVCSVKTKLSADADKSRFTYIHMQKDNHTNDQWAEVQDLLSIMSPEYCKRFFARCVKLIPVTLKNKEILQKAFVGSGRSQRLGQQYGSLLAGFVSLSQQTIISEDSAKQLVSMIKIEEEDTVSGIRDQEEALEFFLAKQFHSNQTNATVRNWILKHPADIEILGMKIFPDGLFVKTINPQVNGLFENSKWGSSWDMVLARIKGIQRKQRRLAGINSSRGLLIPMELIENSENGPVELYAV